MAKKKELSESETSSDEPETPEKAGREYEQQRQSRIAANRARMEALGLRTMANSLMSSADTSTSRERKGKAKPKKVKQQQKEDDDDEYEPNDENDDDDDDEDDDDDSNGDSSDDFEEEIVNGRNSRSRSKKVKNRKRTSKPISVQKAVDPEYMDEDEALKQAIALSLKDYGEASDLVRGGSSEGLTPQAANISDNSHNNVQEDNTRRRKRKLFTSRVQMTEDDLVIHFCQFDEVGKGSITLRDLQRMVAVHDFTWTDKECADMIRCFDNDRDGKLSLDDFRNIAQQCNMLQGPKVP